MSYATIEDLRSQLGSAPKAQTSPEYAAKMLHRIPDGTVIKREQFILDECKGRRVLEFGASGPLHDAIVKVASETLGVDRESNELVAGFDLDEVSPLAMSLPGYDWNPDVIICGEILEHLANPGWFLQRLRAHHVDVPVIITVPNAYSSVGRHHIRKGYENVNIDHVSWYSPRVMWTLLERYGYSVEAFHWYNGEPYFAEGFVVVTR